MRTAGPGVGVMLLTSLLCGAALAQQPGASPSPAQPNPAQAAAARPVAELLGDPELESRAGSAGLSWQVASGANHEAPLTYQLQRAASGDLEGAHTLYTGPDQGRFISGMENGAYQFRVRARSGHEPWGAWSKTQTLRVEHWSAARALGLMALGALVFCATAFVVLRGAPDDDLPEPKVDRR